MNPLAIGFFVLAFAVLLFTVVLIMKTTELSAAINNLSAATLALATAVDKAADALTNQGANTTPDADIVPLIGAVESITSTLSAATSKLAAATPPPTT